MASGNGKSDTRLMKGNEALAEAALRAGMQAYFGYPITPQTEIMEYLALQQPNFPGVVILQAESELAAINMVHGASGAGARAMISSSSPGISLMQECLSYMASAQLPAVIVNVQRGGPGLGTIQPSQADYFQAVKGGGHGDYHLIVLAPSSVQEMVDFMFDAFRLTEKYRNPAMILADGALGQMMEKVTLPAADSLPKTNAPWATIGKPNSRERNIITSLFIQPERMEKLNLDLQEKYRQLQKEVRWEELQTEDADIVLVAFGLTSRICGKTMNLARERIKGRATSPHHAVSISIRCARKAGGTCKCISYGRDECGANGRRCSTGSQWKMPCTFLRTDGRNDSIAGRSADKG